MLPLHVFSARYLLRSLTPEQSFELDLFGQSVDLPLGEQAEAIQGLPKTPQGFQTPNYNGDHDHTPPRVLSGQVSCQLPILVSLLMFLFCKQRLPCHCTLQDHNFSFTLQVQNEVESPIRELPVSRNCLVNCYLSPGTLKCQLSTPYLIESGTTTSNFFTKAFSNW